MTSAIKAERGNSVRFWKIDSIDGKSLADLRDELDEMTDVLLGRVPPPIDLGPATLMEVAEAFHARASEMEMRIHAGEVDGHIPKGSHTYKFRTGQLRTFIEMAKRAIDLGSRRITVVEMEAKMREGM